MNLIVPLRQLAATAFKDLIIIFNFLLLALT